MKKPLQKSRIPENNAFIIRELIAPFFDVNWHFHSEFQLFVVLKGRGTRFIGDHMQAFREGDMVLTGPNLPHLWKNDKAYHDPENGLETHGIVIYFPDNFLRESVFRLEEFEGIAQMLRKSERGIEVTGKANQQITQMMKDMLHMKGAESIIQLLKILNLMVDSPDCHLIANAGYINTNKESEKDRMGQVYEYVMQNFQEKVTLEEAARISNLSVSAFSRFFKSRVNKSFSDFLTDVRISHACKLLHETDLNVSEIAYECGFFTLSNFNRLFRDRVQKTPLEYRKEFMESFLAVT
ncbi:AraC family transcriptional regulator [Algoriphagus sanaruensis]|uniref:AraC family transcriptional regulator n=1 Tax=Algoriphagus sanaruensis TaxID=1727163 RepID=A0A142EPS2_9BACT|nr:AraC family transcriptional regulator [Algoriphagus sanaruensis]AMQ57127.1 AraC family transcriptional regulator [Algoriphagus sanaruensis]